MKFNSLQELYKYAKQKNKVTYRSIGGTLNLSSSFVCMSLAGVRPIKPENYRRWISAMNAEAFITEEEFGHLAALEKDKITLNLSKCTDAQKEILCSLADAVNSAENPDQISKHLKENLQKC